MWSFGGAPAGVHMPYAGATGMVTTVQVAAFQDASPVGVHVTETILPAPPVLVDQDDVVMSGSGRTRTRSGHRSRTSHILHRSWKCSPSEPSSDSGSDTDARRSRRSSKHHSRSSKRPSKPKRSPSRSVKSEWTRRSERSVRSEMSGASQVALDTMRSAQEALARIESTQAQQIKSLHQAVQVIQALVAQASSKEERITQALEAQAHTSEQTPARPTRIPVAQPSASSTNIEDIREEEARRAQAMPKRSSKSACNNDVSTSKLNKRLGQPPTDDQVLHRTLAASSSLGSSPPTVNSSSSVSSNGDPANWASRYCLSMPSIFRASLPSRNSSPSPANIPHATDRIKTGYTIGTSSKSSTTSLSRLTKLRSAIFAPTGILNGVTTSVSCTLRSESTN
ncbi:unnamed protein product [Phytophthora fragariaefolia]|uniref:Unnamed protein product n=1 Tax=Phytophthora fragariaefolia TaxID=1490495 RepID=A0A9W6YDN7_9STRA|nr:unnamed protein product [Phytophthora fragariaefolia]